MVLDLYIEYDQVCAGVHFCLFLQTFALFSLLQLEIIQWHFLCKSNPTVIQCLQVTNRVSY